MDEMTAQPTGIATRSVWLISVRALALAAIATEAYGLVARVIGVPMRAGTPGSHVSTPITVGMFAMATLIVGFWATLLAIALARFVRHPARTYFWTAITLTVGSMAAPLSAGDTPVSTKLMLCGGHLVAAAIVIPAVTRRLAPTETTTAVHDYTAASPTED